MEGLKAFEGLAAIKTSFLIEATRRHHRAQQAGVQFDQLHQHLDEGNRILTGAPTAFQALVQ